MSYVHAMEEEQWRKQQMSELTLEQFEWNIKQYIKDEDWVVRQAILAHDAARTALEQR